MAYVVAQPCLTTIDRACVEVCPVACFYEGGDQLIIHPAECVDCDACRPACPVSAIFPEADVPGEWHSFIAKNADFVKSTSNLVRAKTKTEVEEAHLDTFAVSREAVAAAAAGAAAPVAVAEAPVPSQVEVPAPSGVSRGFEAPAAATVEAAPPPKVEAPKPAAAPPPKKAEVKPPPPTVLSSDLYKRALDLLREVVALQQAGQLTPEKAAEAEKMVAEIRGELSLATGKDKFSLADLEKKSITFRQGEEVARALLSAIEDTEIERVIAEGRRKLAEYAAGVATLGAITLFIGWMTVRIVLAKPLSLGLPLTPEVLKTAILDPEALPLFAAFSALGGILSLFTVGALIPLWRTAQDVMGVWRSREQKRLGMRVAEVES